MMKNIPEYYPIYDTVYGTEIPTEQYYVIKFDTLPSKYVNVIFYDISVIDFCACVAAWFLLQLQQ
jgi:hypothetical protein